MPPTVSSLLARPELQLRCLVDVDLRRPVDWVHVSELADPTAWLSGGELLLTAGLLAQDTVEYWDQYVCRLVDRGVAGLGFGVGLRFEDVPALLVDAAGRFGLPLLVVPGLVPFIAIAKSVAADLAREEQQSLLSAVETQQVLIKAAAGGTGRRAVVNQLAKALDAWVLLLDERGELRHCSPGEARRYSTRIRVDLDRLTSADLLRASALTIAGHNVAVLPIGVSGKVGGFLVVGRDRTLAMAEHSVLTTAVGLLSLAFASEQELRQGERRAARGVMQLAVNGHAELAERLADTLGVLLPDGPLRLALLGASPEHQPDLLRAAEMHQEAALVVEYEPNLITVLLPAAESGLVALEEVLHQVPQARGVVSDAVRMADLADSWRQVRSVFFGAAPTPGTLLATHDVVMTGLLAQLDSPNATGWASALLEPLERREGRAKSSLIETLRVFLANNGHLEKAASTLGIHRHTLRYRLGRITGLLGCELDDPTVRAELWIALRLREHH